MVNGQGPMASGLFGQSGEPVPEVAPEDITAIARKCRDIEKQFPGKPFAFSMETLRDLCTPDSDVRAVWYRFVCVNILRLIEREMHSADPALAEFRRSMDSILKDGELTDAALDASAAIPMIWRVEGEGLPFDFDEFLRLCAK